MHDEVFAQNTFSQFYSSPLTINAANTGRFDGNYRVGGINRNEKKSSGISNQASFFFDTRILASFLPDNDKIAIGTVASYEKNSINGVFKKTNISLSLAYHKSLNEEGSTLISVGFQLGISSQSLEFPPYIFEDQIADWLRSGYSGLQFSQSKNISFSYPDLNIGAGYQTQLNSDNRITAGISLLHANSPSRSFNGGEFKLTRVGSLQLGWERSINPRSKFYTSFLVDYTQQDKLSNIYGNIFYRARIEETSYKIGIGSSFRKSVIAGDAVIPCVALYYGRFILNTAYDINISSKTTAQRSAFEISILYTALQRAQ